jgi:hypothetical protein
MVVRGEWAVPFCVLLACACTDDDVARDAGDAGNTGGTSAASDSGDTLNVPEAALELSVAPRFGSHCEGAHGQLLIPQNREVDQALNCDFSASTSCTPSAHVVRDGDPNASVSCTIALLNGSYAVSASVALAGDTLSLAGTVDSTGGTLVVTHRSASTQINLRGDCTIRFPPDRGLLGPGKLWGPLSCPALTDTGSAAGDQCDGEGIVLFQRCTSDLTVQ